MTALLLPCIILGASTAAVVSMMLRAPLGYEVEGVGFIYGEPGDQPSGNLPEPLTAAPATRGGSCPGARLEAGAGVSVAGRVHIRGNTYSGQQDVG